MRKVYLLVDNYLVTVQYSDFKLTSAASAKLRKRKAPNDAKLC